MWTPLSHPSCYFKILSHTATIHNGALYIIVNNRKPVFEVAAKFKHFKRFFI